MPRNNKDSKRKRLDRVEETLSMLIGWIAQSSLGVISHDDAKKLLETLHNKQE